MKIGLKIRKTYYGISDEENESEEYIDVIVTYEVIENIETYEKF